MAEKQLLAPESTMHTGVSLDGGTLALIIVDMQNDFADPKGTLFGQRAQEIIPAIRELKSRAREAGTAVFYTQDWHRVDDPEFGIWGQHAAAGTWGAEIVKELAPQEADTVIQKTSYDAFYGTPLDHLLRSRGVKTIIVTGTIANICVLHTAGSAALRGYHVVFPVDAVAALNDFDRELAIRQVSFLYQGIVTTVEEIEIT